MGGYGGRNFCTRTVLLSRSVTSTSIGGQWPVNRYCACRASRAGAELLINYVDSKGAESEHTIVNVYSLGYT